MLWNPLFKGLNRCGSKTVYWILLRLPAQVGQQNLLQVVLLVDDCYQLWHGANRLQIRKGCELIATAFGWPSVLGISLLPPTESEARNIFPKGRSKLDVAKHFASVLQPVPSRATTCMSQAGSMLSLAALRLCLKEPLTISTTKRWRRAGYHPLLPGEFMQQKRLPTLVFVVRGHALHLVAAFHFSKKALENRKCIL